MHSSKTHSEERFRALFQNIPVPTFVWQRQDKGFVLADYNEAADRLTEGRLATYHGERAGTMYADRPDIVEDMNRCLVERRTIRREMSYRLCSTGGDREMWVHYAFVPPDLVMVHTEDITERKRAEQSLQESEKKFHQLFDEMIYGVALHEIICDDHGVPCDYRFLDVNTAFERMTGLARADTVGRTVLEVLPGTEPSWIETYGRVALTGEPAHFENYSQALDKHFEVRAFQPRPGHFACSFHDITSRKRTEEEKRQLALRLLQAEDAERRRIAQDLHDEIGGLLTALQLSLRMHASQEGVGVLSEEEAIVEKLALHVREIARMLRPSVLDDLGLVPALRWLCDRYTARTNVTVSFYHELGAQARFAPAVENTVYRIVQEALTNVARHAGVGAVQVLLHHEPEHMVVRVIDEGCGFDTEAHPVPGDSLGLSGMKERAALLNGSLDIQSSPGVGTRVSVTLPLR